MSGHVSPMPISLPNEIWLEILGLVADQAHPNVYSLQYAPFEQVPEDDGLLTTDTAVLGVCRSWRQSEWAPQLILRNLVIGGQGQHGLKHLLQDSDFSQMVKPPVHQDILPYLATIQVHRIVLHFDATTTQTLRDNPLPSVDILRLCKNVQVLTRPSRPIAMDGPGFDFDADAVRLPSLRRLDYHINIAAERSGGINSLAAVVRGAPNLEYLSITSFPVLSHFGLDTFPLTAPALRILRLKSVPGMIVYQLSNRWTMPSLTHVVLDLPTPYAKDGLDTLWAAHGNSLQIVEFGRHLRFLSFDFIGPCIARCPNLLQLNYHALFSAPPQWRGRHNSLQSVGLNCVVNEMLLSETSQVLAEHFERLLHRDRYPMLSRISLHNAGSLDAAPLKAMSERVEVYLEPR